MRSFRLTCLFFLQDPVLVFYVLSLPTYIPLPFLLPSSLESYLLIVFTLYALGYLLLRASPANKQA